MIALPEGTELSFRRITEYPWAAILNTNDGKQHQVEYLGTSPRDVDVSLRVRITEYNTESRLDPTRFIVLVSSGANNDELYYKEDIFPFLRNLVEVHSFHPVEERVLQGIIGRVASLRE